MKLSGLTASPAPCTGWGAVEDPTLFVGRSPAVGPAVGPAFFAGRSLWGAARPARASITQEVKTGLELPSILFQELVSPDRGLSEDCAECRALEGAVVGDGEHRAASIRIVSSHGDMVSLAGYDESEALQGLDYVSDRRVNGELGHYRPIPVSATKASITSSWPSRTPFPNASTWNRIADLKSARASS